jgi:probable phosphoglycerate mutase
VYSAIDEIQEKYRKQNVLIVAHGGVCRIIETYHSDMTVFQFSKYFFRHCDLKCWELNI